jgi:hypothetical protein
MDRVEELNARIYDRFVPSGAPQMVFSPRPVQTKYAKQPVMDEHKPSIPIQRGAVVRFLPSSGVGPIGQYCVDTESTLKGGNLFYALQKDARAAYIPGSASDLYNAPDTNSSQPVPQPHPRLFSHVVASPSPAPNVELPTQIFYNTRVRRVATTK